MISAIVQTHRWQSRTKSHRSESSTGVQEVLEHELIPALSELLGNNDSLAQRCADVLGAHGVRSTDDWALLEQASLADRVLDELRPLMNTVQLSKLRLMLRGENSPRAASAHAAVSEEHDAKEEEDTDAFGWPRLRLLARYTLRSALHELLLVFHFSWQWQTCLLNSRTTESLRSTLFSASELIILTSALLLGCAFGLVASDVQMKMEDWLDAASFSTDLAFAWCSFATSISEFGLMFALTPVADINLRAMVKANIFLIWQGKIWFIFSIYMGCLALLLKAARMFTSQAGDSLSATMTALPLAVCMTLFMLAFMMVLPLNVTGRMAAHSGALCPKAVLPPGSSRWSTAKTTNELVRLALDNPDLNTLYSNQHGAAVSAATSRPMRKARSRHRLDRGPGSSSRSRSWRRALKVTPK